MSSTGANQTESGGALTSAPASTNRLYLAAAVLALVGLADSIYLTVKHLTSQSVQCTITTGCDVVLGSAYATVGGFPLASLGALAYFSVFSLAVLTFFRYRGTRMLLLVVVGVMTLMTIRLLYVQAVVLNHYCEFCLLSAAITLALAVLMVGVVLSGRGRGAST
jgi:uncharacterized membrane protein